MGKLVKISKVEEKNIIMFFLKTNQVPANLNMFEKRAFKRKLNKFIIIDEKRFKKVDKIKTEIIRILHSNVHFGLKKVFNLIKNDYIGITREMVSNVVGDCVDCRVTDPIRTVEHWK